MEVGSWLYIKIQEDSEVDRAVAELGNPQSRFTIILFTEEEAARVVGNKGNLAVHNKIAPAVERAKRSIVNGISLHINYCNLDEQAVLRLASAVEKSTCIGKIYCKNNPGDNERTEEAMERAIIATKSPINKWNGWELPADVVQARREREANPPNPTAEEAKMTEASISSLSTRVPTAEEFYLAQRECASIAPQIASKGDALKLRMDQLARGEAEGKALEVRMRELQAQMQVLQKKNGELRFGNDKMKAEMDALKQRLVPHEAVIKRVHDLKGMFDKLNLSPSAAAATVPPPPHEANLCPICCVNAINASFLCGHRFCKACADTMFQSAKKECPNCRKRIKGVIPSY